jgi:hypothetical protein
MDGRTPVNPQVVPECTSVNYDEHEWVGFKIHVPSSVPGGAGFDYYFEFEEGAIGEKYPIVKRQTFNSLVVAGNIGREYPMDPEPLLIRINNIHQFHVYRVKGGPVPYRIGIIDIEFLPDDKNIKFCRNMGQMWDSGFQLYTITAENTDIVGNKQGEISNDNSEIHIGSNLDFDPIISNPVGETINIFNVNLTNVDEFYSVEIISLSGSNLIFMNSLRGDLEIPLHFLPSGIYYLKITSEKKTKCIRFVKP